MEKNKTIKIRFRSILIAIILVIFSLNALYPIFYTLISAFKTRKEYIFNPLGFPKDFVLSNIIEIISNKQIPVFFMNSIILTFTSCFIVLVVSSLAAFAFAKLPMYGKQVLFTINIILISIPAIVMIFPLFVLINSLGLTDSYISLIIIYPGILIPWSIYMITRFFENIPDELLEAARLDGCSGIKIIWYIILPLSKAALATNFFVNALWVWNDLLLPLIFLKSDAKRTLMVGLTLIQNRVEMNVPLVMASLLIVMIPLIAAYALAQRYFIQGLTEGSIK